MQAMYPTFVCWLRFIDELKFVASRGLQNMKPMLLF